MAKVYAPNEDFTGTTASTPFAGGVAHDVRNPHLLSWFESRGYRVEHDEGEEVVDEGEEVVDGVEENEDTKDIEGTDGDLDGGEGNTSKPKSKKPRKPSTRKPK